MNIKDVYNRCWKDKALTSFTSYDRNSVLAKFLPVTVTSQAILDLGCGDGAVSEWLMRRGYTVTSADFNLSAIEATKSRGLAKVLCLDVEQPLPFGDGSFDLVFWGDVVEHLFDPEATLKEINRVLKQGGQLVISCPNVGYLGFRLRYLISGSIRAVELAGQEPWEQEHIRFFNANDLNKLLLKVGFKEEKRAGVNRLWHSKLLVKIFPKLFGYIQIVAAIKL